jgi:hypothetical protein
MQKKIQKFGAGEILFGLVIILGIISTFAVFFVEEPLGMSQESFFLVSSLAFIGAFVLLSVYARWIKRTHSQQYQLRKALQAWQAYLHTPPNQHVRPLPKGTIAAFAAAYYKLSGFVPVSDPPPKTEGMLLMADTHGRSVLIDSVQVPRPLTLREMVTFYEALRASTAKQGEVWALAGFSPEAALWASKKPITLVDMDGIQRVIDRLEQG